MSQPAEKITPITGELMPADTVATVNGAGALATQANSQATELAKQAAALTIDSQDSLEAGVDLARDIKARHKRLDDERKALTGPLDETKKRIMDLFRGPLAELKAAEDAIKGKARAYQTRIEEEARKAAEAEAERLRKNAEKRAQRAAEKGDEEVAEDIRQQADMEAQAAASAIEHAPAPAAKGLSMRDNWKVQVVDPKALIIAVADALRDGNNPMLHADLLQPNYTELNKLAKALKDNLKAPGLRVFNDKVSAIR